jgi:hypothetical protein
MKKTIILIAMLMLVSVSAYAEQKLVNITEDTIADDSYKPVAGKEFLVAVKLQDEVQGQDPQPVSGQTIQFQTSVGTLSDVEVITNIYGEAITWLRTDSTPDTAHTITTKVKDNNDITPVSITVKNIALPSGAPTADQLVADADANADKIKDITADIQVTSNAPWEGPVRQLKIWEKGEKQKVQEISPNPNTTITPEISITNQPEFVKDIVAYNQTSNIYAVKYRQKTQPNVFPFDMDYIDPVKGIIVSKSSYVKEGSTINKTLTEDSDFTLMNSIWVFQKEKQNVYNGVGVVQYNTVYQYSNIHINTGLPDSEFIQ